MLIALEPFLKRSDKDYLSKFRLENGVKISKLTGGKIGECRNKGRFIITSINKKKVYTSSDVQKMLENKTGNVLVEGVYPNGMIASYGFGL